MADGVRPIIDGALRGGAEQLASGNHIRLDCNAEKTAVIITMHVTGLDELWITYDAPQLDELIRNLQTTREDLR